MELGHAEHEVLAKTLRCSARCNPVGGPYPIASNARPQSGFGDLAVGIKQQLRSGPDGFELAAIISLSLPAGAAAISSHGYDPSFQLPWSRKLSSTWTAAGMLSIYVPTENGSHRVVGESTFLVDRQLTKAWDAFTEYAGDFPQAYRRTH
jgi:Putative MetA-pathway of phenol degradation